MADQFKVHCRIIDYVEIANKELATIIKGVCADGSLGSLKGKPGITFLMPVDKNFLKKLHDLAYSANVDDVDKANELINNLIVRDILRTPGDWMTHRDDIPNSLFPSQKLDVDSVSGETVVFKSGAKAVVDKGFKDGSHRKNLAVWKLTGEIPVTDDKPSEGKYIKLARKNGKSGGYTPSTVESQSLRFKIMQQVESEYYAAACNRANGSWWSAESHPSSVYNRYVASLIDWMLANGHADLVRDVIVPQLSFDIIDFYAIFEPHRGSGNYLLSDSIINGWYGSKHAGVVSKEQLQQLLNAKSDAIVYSNRKCIIACTKKLQAEFEACANSNKMRACAEQVAKYYDILDAENRIGDALKVFPQPLADFYRENPGLKQTQDELRYVSIGMTHKFEQSCNTGLFHELSNLIGECLHAHNKAERMANLQLLNSTALRFHVAPQDRVRDIKAFVKSAMFMYIPLNENEIKEESSKKRPQVDGIALPDVRGNIYAKYTFELPSTGYSGACELTVGSIQRMNFNELSDDVKEALISFVSQ